MPEENSCEHSRDNFMEIKKGHLSIIVPNLDTFLFEWGGGYGIVLERQQIMAHKHIPIETWLDALGMKEYQDLFNGYRGVEDLLNLTEAEVRDLGVKNSAHRAKVVSSLRILKEKYDRGYRTPRVIQRSHSASAQLSGSPGNNVFPDYQIVNVSPERLEHDLISELQSDPSELRHWPWYHGNISRQTAENIIGRNGDFLVRDCTSQPGDFVLTCCWRGAKLHFIINSEVVEKDNRIPEITYAFEDDRFCSVQDLIQFYMSHKKTITKSTGAIILSPVSRTMPLSYYDIKYGYTGSPVTSGVQNQSHNSKGSPFSSPKTSPGGSPNSRRRPCRAGSQPMISVDNSSREEIDINQGSLFDRCESLPMIHRQQISPSHQTLSQPPPEQFHHQRSGSEPSLNPEVTSNRNIPPSNYLSVQQKMAPSTSDSHLNKPPPPKPSRIPSVKYIGKERPKIAVRNKELYDEDDGRDYSDYSQVKEAPSWLNNKQKVFNANYYNNRTQSNNNESDYDNNFNNISNENRYPNERVTQNPMTIELPDKVRKKSDSRFSFLDNRDYAEIPPSPLTPKGKQIQVIGEDNEVEEEEVKVQMRKKRVILPKLETGSSLKPTEFKSALLHSDNKPLDPSVLLTVKKSLLDTNTHKLAEHITKVDLDLLKVLNENDLGLGVQSGLELVTLPHGKQLRQDIIERCYCMKVFVMAMTLTCTGVVERARMLSQWIQVAVDLRTTFGNLFGFSSVMEGLTSPQIMRLRDTWLILRQNHTSSAFQFDTKLKSAYKSLTDGSGLLPLQNVSVPDIAPLIFLLERNEENLCTSNLPWENSDQNSGLDILLTHLDTARLITAQCGLYRVTAENLMKSVKTENHLLDMFQTEFHLRILWGSKGCIVDRTERQNKYEQLLTVLSDRAEPPGDDGTAL